MRWLLALYPRAWRDRYSREVASLTEELIRSGDRTRLRAGLGLAGAAAAERMRTLSRPATAIAARARAAQASPLGLVVRNLAFTVVVPGLGGAWEPWWILTHHGPSPAPAAWEAVSVIAAGTALYVWCVWNFAAGAIVKTCGSRSFKRLRVAGPRRVVRRACR